MIYMCNFPYEMCPILPMLKCTVKLFVCWLDHRMISSSYNTNLKANSCFSHLLIWGNTKSLGATPDLRIYRSCTCIAVVVTLQRMVHDPFPPPGHHHHHQSFVLLDLCTAWPHPGHTVQCNVLHDSGHAWTCPWTCLFCKNKECHKFLQK